MQVVLNFPLFMAVLGLPCCAGFYLVVLCKLLIATASLVAEHGLWSLLVSPVVCGVNTGAVVVAHGLRCSAECRISQIRNQTRVTSIGR